VGGVPSGHGRLLHAEDPEMITASGTAAMFVLATPRTMPAGCDRYNPFVAVRVCRERASATPPI